MMNRHEFTYLENFLAGYFHEDWTLEAAEPDDIIENFVCESGSDGEFMRIADDIDAYLNGKAGANISEDDLVREFGCYYAPSSDGLSSRDWLIHVRDRMRRVCAPPVTNPEHGKFRPR